MARRPYLCRAFLVSRRVGVRAFGRPAWPPSPPPPPSFVIVTPEDVDRQVLSQVQILEGLHCFQGLGQLLEFIQLPCFTPEVFNLGPKSFQLRPIESVRTDPSPHAEPSAV